ncbi:MAG: hypothetical protein AB8G11_02310 [Saprospiraceae bacterium]
MSETKKSRAKYWVYTLLSLVGTIVLLLFATSWFWVGLPFLLTYLVLALDVM